MYTALSHDSTKYTHLVMHQAIALSHDSAIKLMRTSHSHSRDLVYYLPVLPTIKQCMCLTMLGEHMITGWCGTSRWNAIKNALGRPNIALSIDTLLIPVVRKWIRYHPWRWEPTTCPLDDPMGQGRSLCVAYTTHDQRSLINKKVSYYLYRGGQKTNHY